MGERYLDKNIEEACTKLVAREIMMSDDYSVMFPEGTQNIDLNAKVQKIDEEVRRILVPVPRVHHRRGHGWMMMDNRLIKAMQRLKDAMKELGEASKNSSENHEAEIDQAVKRELAMAEQDGIEMTEEEAREIHTISGVPTPSKMRLDNAFSKYDDALRGL